MVKTPFGYIDISFDLKSPLMIDVKKSQIGKDKLYPNIEYVLLISFEYTSDNAEHLLTCTLERNDVCGEIESGEHLDAISFYVDSGKLTIGCKSDFGVPNEGGFDYDGKYLKNGLEICISPDTKSQVFTFGISWLYTVTDETDIQTWFASDPSTHQ